MAIRFLLQQQDMNIALLDANHFTALNIATMHGHQDAVKLFLRYSFILIGYMEAQIERNLELAISYGHIEVMKVLLTYYMVFRNFQYEQKLRNILLHLDQNKNSIAQIAAINNRINILDYLGDCSFIPTSKGEAEKVFPKWLNRIDEGLYHEDILEAPATMDYEHLIDTRHILKQLVKES